LGCVCKVGGQLTPSLEIQAYFSCKEGKKFFFYGFLCFSVCKGLGKYQAQDGRCFLLSRAKLCCQISFSFGAFYFGGGGVRRYQTS